MPFAKKAVEPDADEGGKFPFKKGGKAAAKAVPKKGAKKPPPHKGKK